MWRARRVGVCGGPVVRSECQPGSWFGNGCAGAAYGPQATPEAGEPRAAAASIRCSGAAAASNEAGRGGCEGGGYSIAGDPRGSQTRGACSERNMWVARAPGQDGHAVSRMRVARLLRQACLRSVSRRRGFIVTIERHVHTRPAPDLGPAVQRAGAQPRCWRSTALRA